jgi:hypothetical protein
MAEKDPKVVGQESSQTLTDGQIVTERKMPRRSFLTAAGALLVGAAALASGVRAVAQQGSDPDSKDKNKKRKKTAANTADPDSKAAADADSKDRKKSSDPDSKSKTADPQSKRAAKAKANTPPKSDPDGARY